MQWYKWKLWRFAWDKSPMDSNCCGLYDKHGVYWHKITARLRFRWGKQQ